MFNRGIANVSQETIDGMSKNLEVLSSFIIER